MIFNLLKSVVVCFTFVHFLYDISCCHLYHNYSMHVDSLEEYSLFSISLLVVADVYVAPTVEHCQAEEESSTLVFHLKKSAKTSEL